MKNRIYLFGSIAVLAAVGLGAGLWKAWAAPAGAPDRTVVISARDYRFNGTNPDLNFRAGERVRLVFRNDEPAEDEVEHNFKIVGLGVRCSKALKSGETEEIVVTVPQAGEYGYTCCAHPGMGGRVTVAPAKDP